MAVWVMKRLLKMYLNEDPILFNVLENKVLTKQIPG